MFIAFFFSLGIYTLYLFYYNFDKSSIHSKLVKYILLIIGFSPILIITLHNWYFGNQFILLTSSFAVTENLRVPPYIWTNALYDLLDFKLDKEGWNIILKNLKTWINFYEFWLMVIYVNLWIGFFRKNNYFLFRLISFSLIVSHLVYLFYAGDHRYTYGLWTLCLLIFFRDFKEFYYSEFLKEKYKKLEFKRSFNPIFYTLLDPIKN